MKNLINILNPIKQPKHKLHQRLSLMLLIMLSQLSFIANADNTDIDNTLAAQLELTLAKKNNVNLTVSPEKCVAMQQGQNCYITVELYWQAEVEGNYCLFSSLKKQPLQCWNSSNKGNVKKEFATKENLYFYLRLQNAQNALASAKVKMAWVHKKKGKPRMSWRMF